MTGVNRISDLTLERYLLGELSAEEMKALQQREAEDEIFAARVRALRQENARVLAENPFEALEEKLDAVESVRSAKGLNRYALAMKVAAALVVALGIFSAVFMNRDVVVADAANPSMEVALADVQDDGVRIKGMSPSLEVWKKTGDSAVQVQNLGEATEGDEIQLRYRVAQKCYGMLISMDGNGTVTMHMGKGNTAVPLEPGKMTTLPFAYKLDNAPKFEKFFLLTSGETFEFDGREIDEILKRKGIESVSFTLRKVEK